jgi:hypothetical protein
MHVEGRRASGSAKLQTTLQFNRVLRGAIISFLRQVDCKLSSRIVCPRVPNKPNKACDANGLGPVRCCSNSEVGTINVEGRHAIKLRRCKVVLEIGHRAPTPRMLDRERG